MCWEAGKPGTREKLANRNTHFSTLLDKTESMFEKFILKPGISAKGTKVGVIWGQDSDP